MGSQNLSFLLDLIYIITFVKQKHSKKGRQIHKEKY